MSFLKWLFRREKESSYASRRRHASEIDTTPDIPQAFGYKTSWFAIKSDQSKKVADLFEIQNQKPSNWASGLSCSFQNKIFVSPPINGWIFVVSQSLPFIGDPLIPTAEDMIQRYSHIADNFENVQFFGSHRVVDAAVYAWAVNGKWQRIFSISEGEVHSNYGLYSEPERQLNILNLSELSCRAATDRITKAFEEYEESESLINDMPIVVEETYILELAGLLSINPIKLDKTHEPLGVGIIGEQPAWMTE
ncbi:hypothetical protein [Larsenimonas rhizosphaerae]|uniref:Uncharacterized protein n=1 Tax=Larsenimonas rhizosphaerae TaxID=2944682 RepID=A0AA41ZIR5_9GAMM|nr:hypothetical protein [Larsenimonas rhizosphaerae]MCX2525496.1 hypothetical protein [Larsenimonas rhizosphaerae]